MRLLALCMARNEAEIIGTVCEHLWANGVDRIVVEDGYSTDDTIAVAAAHGADVIMEKTREWDQSAAMSRLAATYAEPGDWVVPFDADELWCPVDHPTLAECFKAHEDASKLWAQMFVHRDWDTRAARPKPLAKVAFRYQTGCVVADGYHNVTVPGVDVWGQLQIRELQYRSWEHFLAKVHKAAELFERSPNMNPQSGAHMRRLVAMNPAELLDEWRRLEAGEWGGWTHDPIPTPVPAP